MFTGIIEEIGHIKKIKHGAKSATLTIQANHVTKDTVIGDSISTNGVCLTVTNLETNGFDVDVMNETLQRSNLKELKTGSQVNLERALTLQTRLGGHMVSGHIDGVGILSDVKKDDIAYRITIKTEPHITRYIIEKGSIAVDGISLTVVNVWSHTFEVSIIPHTKDQTTLLNKKVGETVNLECDMIGKYVEKLFSNKKNNDIDYDMLKRYGYE
jgi:riboflavin synthase